MVEFNPDGSIKLPQKIQEQENKNKWRLQHARCLEVKKEMVSYSAPKRCLLHITFSEKITNTTFVGVILNQMKEHLKTPVSLLDSNTIEIGTHFKRCSDCSAIIGRLREQMDGNLILKNGNCPHETRRQMAFEDYFD